jgi:hypothetical protein
MTPPLSLFRVSILALAAILLALSPATSRAQATGITATGTGALQSVTTGIDDSAFGLDALHATTTGAYDTAIGANALASDTTGNRNTATGMNALFLNTSGWYNTAAGVSALYSNTGGGSNGATGYQALFYNTTGSGNVAEGFQALRANTTGTFNIATGYEALVNNTTGFENTALGGLSLSANTTGEANTAAGAYSLYSNTTGSLNTASGYQALYFDTAGSNNIATGINAGLNLTTGSNNIEIGDYNLYTNTADDLAGESNTIRLGEASTQTATYIAGIYGASSTDPTATLVFVDHAGHLVTSSAAPLSLPAGSVTGAELAGNLTLGGTTTGIFSGNGSNLTGVTVAASAITGSIAAGQLAAGAVGSAQLGPNITLGGNTSLNEISLPATDSTGSNGVLNIGGNPFLNGYGAGNTFLGGAGNFSMTGTGNTAAGYQALLNNSAGSNNIAAGRGAGFNLTTGSNNVDIGDYNPTTGPDDVAGEANTIRLGEASTQTATYIAGIYGASSTSSSATLVYVDQAGHLVTSSTAPLNFSGGSIPGADLAAGSVTGAQIASGAVGNTQLAAGAVANTNLAAGSVGSTQLAPNLTLGGLTNASSIAVGTNVAASGTDSSAFGYGSIASGAYSFAAGVGTTAQAYDSVVLGAYNTLSGSGTSWVTTDPLFTIGNGTSSSAPSTALTVLKNGNVGIATTTPDSRLQISANTSAGPSGLPSGTLMHLLSANGVVARQVFDSFGISGAGSVFECRSAEGTAASPTASQSGDILGQYIFDGYGTTNFGGSGRAKILAIADQNWSDVAQGTDITFQTTADNTTTTSEAMRIASTGKVGIATATPLSSLDINGSVATGAYAGTTAAPANGMIVSGSVGIGTSSPQARLDVSGPVMVSGSGSAVLINPQGDLSMGPFTTGTIPQ